VEFNRSLLPVVHRSILDNGCSINGNISRTHTQLMCSILPTLVFESAVVDACPEPGGPMHCSYHGGTL